MSISALKFLPVVALYQVELPPLKLRRANPISQSISLSRPLHNYPTKLPSPQPPQNGGFVTITSWLPPKCLGGMITAKKMRENLKIIIINIRYYLTNNYISAILFPINFFLEELWDTNKWI